MPEKSTLSGFSAGVTLATLFNANRNSLNAVRLILATSVIISHSWVIGNIGPEPGAGGMHLGTWAVLGFFAVSGYLITRSRLNGQSLRSFYTARFLRIYPGFLVCLLAVAFIFAPLSLLVGSPGTFTLLDSLSYIARNFLLYPPFISQINIGSTIPDVPVPGIWNGSLWTLFWEASCYVAVGTVCYVKSARLRAMAIGVGFLFASVVSLAGLQGWIQGGLLTLVSPLVAAFCAGALLFHVSDRVRVLPAALISVALLILSIIMGTAAALAPLPVAVIIMALGSVLPFQSVGAKSDLSYGVYIYGVPVQNILEIGWPDLPLLPFILLSVGLTFPLAWLSFRFIESPALGLKSRLRKPSSKATVVAGS